MSNVIHLTGPQSAAVSGTSATDTHARIEPIAMTDGTFIVGAQILTDPAHAAKLPTLQAAPVVDIVTLLAIMPAVSIDGTVISATSATVG